MLLIIFKRLIPFLLMSAMATAQMVPVTDQGTTSAITSAAGSIGTSVINLQNANASGNSATVAAINGNGKILTNINSVLANVMVGIARGQEQVKQVRQNADLYDPSMGAKAAGSCGVLSYTIATVAGKNLQTAVQAKNKTSSYTHINRSEYKNAAADDLNQDVATNFMSVIDRERELAETYGEVGVTDSSGLPAKNTEAWGLLNNKMTHMAVPLSEDINPNDPDIINAPKYIQMERQKMVAGIINEHVADRTKVYSSEWIKDLMVSLSGGEDYSGLDASVLEDIDSVVSRNDSLEILSTFRMKSPNWLLVTGGSTNEIGLARDSNIMQAQQLELLNEILKELKQGNLLLAYTYAHNIEVSGPPENL